MLSEDVMMGEIGDPLMGNVPFGDDSLSTQGAYDFSYAGEMQY
jgi:hypothetical protein